MLLKGKNAVITGCLQGIGNATMRQFAKEGANIWAGCQYEKKEVFEEIEQLQEEYGVWIKPLVFDLTKSEEIKTAVKEIFTSKLPVDSLVNIAGMTHNALFMMTSMEDFHRVFEIDFFSQMQFSQQIVKIMTRRGGGSIVNVSSITGIDGNAGQVAYSAAKGALISATKTMALELGDYRIRVNAVAPGVIDTAMTQALTEEQRQKLVMPCKLKRLGTPEEVAKVVAFLAGGGASHITGQVIRIDGGIG
ncbi:MAG: SDR family NAD(P)-dependent oxidoreductase [Peptococcaceae bacterium]|nr:SDR family NAD(P)-dependent oxidoreductase [Peptococcaceae bacterium]